MTVEENILMRETADEILDLIRSYEFSNLRFYDRLQNGIADIRSGYVPISETIEHVVVPVLDAKKIGNQTIPFGQYSGKRFDDIPLDYLEWLSDSSRDLSSRLDAYLKSKRIRSEYE